MTETFSIIGRRKSNARTTPAEGIPADFFENSSLVSAAAGQLSAGRRTFVRGDRRGNRSSPGYAGEPRYFVTVECRETTGALSRLTLEVNQDEWMRFHLTGEEVCVTPSFRSFRLARCN